jgi:hypothetical protein
MTELRYGQVEGSGHGREYPVAATQYFHRKGGKFVTISSGNISLCASGTTTTIGWADSPKHAAGTDTYTSSATAGKDAMFVVNGIDAVFEIPYYTTVTSSLIGSNIGLINATNLGENATPIAASMQMGKDGSPNEVIQVIDVDVANQTVMVKINPNLKQ